MSNFVRYTCNKKNEPTMREDCQKCPHYNPCGKEGKWCFVGALFAETEKALNIENFVPETLIQDIYNSIAKQIQERTLKIRGLF